MNHAPDPISPSLQRLVIAMAIAQVAIVLIGVYAVARCC